MKENKITKCFRRVVVLLLTLVMMISFVPLTFTAAGYDFSLSTPMEICTFVDNESILWMFENGEPQTKRMENGVEITIYDATDISAPLRVYENGLHILTVFPDGWTEYSIAEYMAITGLYDIAANYSASPQIYGGDVSATVTNGGFWWTNWWTGSPDRVIAYTFDIRGRATNILASVNAVRPYVRSSTQYIRLGNFLNHASGTRYVFVPSGIIVTFGVQGGATLNSNVRLTGSYSATFVD